MLIDFNKFVHAKLKFIGQIGQIGQLLTYSNRKMTKKEI